MRGSCRGYTLAELLVVLAILGIMAAAAVPALGVWLNGEPTAEEAVADLLRDARAVALETARPVTLTLDPATGGWLLEREPDEPVEGRLELGEAELLNTNPRVVVRFGPTGGAEGGPIQVRREDWLIVVRADRWTGEVSIEDT